MLVDIRIDDDSSSKYTHQDCCLALDSHNTHSIDGAKQSQSAVDLKLSLVDVNIVRALADNCDYLLTFNEQAGKLNDVLVHAVGWLIPELKM